MVLPIIRSRGPRCSRFESQPPRSLPVVMGHSEEAESIGIDSVRNGFEDGARGRPLDREGSPFRTNVFNLDGIASRIFGEPVIHGLGGCQSVMFRAKAHAGAVIDDFPPLCRPAQVGRSAFFEAGDITHGDAAQKCRGILTGDVVFIQRRDIDDARPLAECIILTFMANIVCAHCVLTTPDLP